MATDRSARKTSGHQTTTSTDAAPDSGSTHIFDKDTCETYAQIQARLARERAILGEESAD